MNKKKLLLIVGIATVVIIILLVALVIVKSLASKDDGDTSDNGNTTGSEIVLEYWGLWEPEEVMQPIIDRYEEENPGIEIEYTQKSFSQYERNAYTRLVEGATSNSPAPDILRVNNTWLSRFEDYLYPMPTSIMSSQQYSSFFYETAVDDFTGSDGKIYAIPLEIDGLVLFYNKKILSDKGYTAPPTDWDSFKEAVGELTEKDIYGSYTYYGVGMGSAQNVLHSVDILNLIMLQNGVDLLATDGKTVDLKSTEAIISLDYYCSFVEEDEAWSPDTRSDLEMFMSGKLAMMFGPSWRAFDIISASPQLDFGMAIVPQIPTNSPIAYSMYWGEAVAKNSDHPREAWDFIKYLSEQEQLQEMYANSSEIRAFGEPYSRQDMATLISGNPYVSPVLEMAPYMKSWKMGDQSYVEEALRTAIYQACESGKGTSEALSEAEDSINEKLAEFIE